MDSVSAEVRAAGGALPSAGSQPARCLLLEGTFREASTSQHRSLAMDSDSSIHLGRERSLGENRPWNRPAGTGNPASLMALPADRPRSRAAPIFFSTSANS